MFIEKVMNFLKHPAFISIIVLVVGISLVVGIIRAIPEEQIESAPRVDRVYGNPNSKVVLESYSDLQCPACRVYWLNSEKQLLEKYKDTVRFEFKHYPLPIHANAKLAAEASEAAGSQGKFLEFIDYVYEKQSRTESDSWSVEKFTEYARAVGVADIERFERELRNKYYRQAVEEWVDKAEERGVDSTPTIFIDGKKMNSYDFETLSNELDSALSKENPAS